MLKTYELTLRPMAEGRIRGHGAEAIHGWLFHLIKEHNPTFATWLHDQNVKPFALHGLRGRMTHREGYAHLSPSEEYRVRLSTYSREMTEGMDNAIQHLASLDNYNLRIGSVPMQLVQTNTLGDSLSYAALLGESFSQADYHKIHLHFQTPTSFRRQGVQQLFPEPLLTVESLLRRWQLFADVDLPIDEVPPVDQSLRVTQYELGTSMVRFDKYVLIGFRGEAIYTLDKSLTLYQKGVLRSLFRFAEYAGIGYKTTMGMGEVKIRFAK